MATSLSITATYNTEAAQNFGDVCDRRDPSVPISNCERVKVMLWTITIILFVLWVLGLVSSYTMGGWIHILLVLAIIVLLFNLLSGRRAI